ncbi:MAG TPA: GNAT family N-acetyltransferase [Rickettsiales bacterium]|nr:GNAT family N-acetyltransferase [Rickettsiales bacterium]
MMRNVSDFRPFQPFDNEACLALFDQNCPDYFAPNERREFAQYLYVQGHEYRVYEHRGKIGAAFGLHVYSDGHSARINWIMAARNSHKAGIGTVMMHTAIANAKRHPHVKLIHISASQHSASFFTRFGAAQKTIIENGWGPGMHRIEMEIVL